ncbi:zinc ribbon domain-containing protein [Paeniglutamicibacter gangotriensis]|uniref:zinc ribbon domain-containing protein n=1 Tax=Paeniglutamicibacter gangotriensis TaxID=254787 RepID=UPI0037CA4025
MITAHRHQLAANTGKEQALRALFPAFRDTLANLSSLTVRELQAGSPLPKWRILTCLPFDTDLSARQVKSAQNQVHAAHVSWLALLEAAVREMITASTLTGLRRTILHRINSRHAWWATELTLPWKQTPDGELTHATQTYAEKHPEQCVWVPVDPADLKLARHLAKHLGSRKIRRPDLSRVRTLLLDSIIAKPERPTGATAYSWWVTVATLTRGKPVRIPLKNNSYFENLAAQPGARLAGVIQLHLETTGVGQPAGAAISLLLNTRDAPKRETGTVVGLDFGMANALFATSDGRFLGQAMLHTLKSWDQRLTEIAAEHQSRGLKLRDNPEYRALNKRIKSFVTNEIGRVLNILARENGEDRVAELVVEKLDFRGHGMSRRMNRLLTRTGRACVKARLAALTPKYGILVTEVGSAYTSQECSGCGYTAKSNRRGRHFGCRFCGKKLHCDINAARVIRGRRSFPLADHTSVSQRRTTLQRLDQRHRQRWGLRPAAGADPGLAGAPGEMAALAA